MVRINGDFNQKVIIQSDELEWKPSRYPGVSRRCGCLSFEVCVRSYSPLCPPPQLECVYLFCVLLICCILLPSLYINDITVHWLPRCSTQYILQLFLHMYTFLCFSAGFVGNLLQG